MLPADPRKPCLLGSLPSEILLTIMDEFVVVRGLMFYPTEELARRKHNRDAVRSLHSLTLTCRKLHGIATPFLYQSFIHPPEDWAILPKFARTLLINPQLRDYVRYVECHVHLISYWDRKQYMSEGLTIELFHEIIQELDRPDLTRLAPQDMSQFTRAHIFTAVMLLMKNVTHVQSDDSFGALNIFVSPWTHPSLQKYTVQPEPDRRKQCEGLTPLCSHTYVALPGRRDEMWTFDDNKVLEEISFHFCNYTPSWLSEVYFPRIKHQWPDFSQPSDTNRVRLKRFSCRWKRAPGLPELHQPIDLKWLCYELTAFKDTLEYLLLDTTESGWLVSLDETISTAGSLRHFAALKHLDVSGLVLWSDNPETVNAPLVSILPVSLETLIIHVEWDEDVDESLMVLSQDCRSNLPNLKSITVECSGESAPVKHAELLVDLFAMEKVTLTLKNEAKSEEN
ncbi:hypothetical protein DM02DRAFT_612471 [Periconia macrospinosa]|uniref:Leucine-rich repeat domain-containing protein n=1 Tax=Periconia macrospinosa TaxID=97972 RepID=A0A2V1DYX7_9PLEO|nr:hypothetical protein DM02DRAFT_612471 [Periconia macrospinosa]